MLFSPLKYIFLENALCCDILVKLDELLIINFVA